MLDEFPILGVAQFLANHYMLDRARPAWRTPRLRSQDYVHKLVEKVGRDAYRLSSRVRAVHKDRSNKWLIESDSPTALAFDAVILACDAPTASSILGDQAPDLLKQLKVTKMMSVSTATRRSCPQIETRVGGLELPAERRADVLGECATTRC